MEVCQGVKRRYFAYGVNESLLELAVKLREAEVRVKGRTLQKEVPPHSILPGVSSSIRGGRFQFIARRDHVFEKCTESDYVNCDNAAARTVNSVAKVVGFSDNDIHSDMQEDTVEETPATHTKKLSLPNRTGPSLWPFLSSIKASVDAEHIKFLEKNQQFYVNYDESNIAEDYTEPLSEGDFEIIIGNAIGTVLKKYETRAAKQKTHASTNETVIPVKPVVPSTAVAVNTVNTVVNVLPAFETNTVVTMPIQPAVVSKRYAAAIANPRRFRCGLCPYSTNNRSHVRRHHLSVHSDARPFRCYVCNKEFARCENAKVHMVSRHPDVPYDVDRLRNNMFVMPNESIATNHVDIDATPSTNTHSSAMPAAVAAYNRQQDIGISGIASHQPNDSFAIPLWQNFPVIEPKPEKPQQLSNYGNMVNHLLKGVSSGAFPTPTNTMLNVPSLVSSVAPVKQEVSSVVDTKPAACIYCQFVCRNASELAQHVATNHTALKPAFQATPSSNPGYVVLQTAAPIFLFPYGSDSAFPTASQVGLGYHPILPKLPIFSDEQNKSQNESASGQHLSFAAAGSTHRSPQNASNATTASAGTPDISHSTPEKGRSQSPSATPASSEGKRERKRQFKTFYCSRCPDRAPFRYEKSFEKHMKQHRVEDRTTRRVPKIASKVA